MDLKCNLEITFHWKHPLPKTKWENKIWWKCKNIFLIWHFSNLAFSSLLWNIISAVFTKRLKIDVFNHFHFKKMLFLRPLRQPTHRSSLLEMFCSLSTPYYLWAKYFSTPYYLWAWEILPNIFAKLPFHLSLIFNPMLWAGDGWCPTQLICIFISCNMSPDKYKRHQGNLLGQRDPPKWFSSIFLFWISTADRKML